MSPAVRLRSGLVWVWRLDLGVEYVSQVLWAVAVCTPYALIVRASGRDGPCLVEVCKCFDEREMMF